MALLAALVVSLAFQGLRWWCLLRLNGITLSPGRILVYSWIGHFFQMVTPGTLGAEAARFYYITKDVANAKVKTISSVLLDRLIALSAFFMLALFSVFFWDPTILSSSHLWFLVISCVVTMFVTAGIIYKTAQKKQSASGSDDSPQLSAKEMTFWICLAFFFSCIAAVFMALSFQITGMVITHPLDFSVAAVHIPFVMIANGIPITPGGLGLGESISMLAFTRSGYIHGAELMFIVRLGLLIVRLPGVVFYLGAGYLEKKGSA